MFASRSGHLDELLALICEELQLSLTAHEVAERRYHAVGEWLGGPTSTLRAWRPAIYPQGSFRIGTTVRPLSGDDFDLDLVCELDLGDLDVSPLDVLNLVEERLRGRSDYASMIERKKRCIRLEYANEFHLDVLPARPVTLGQGTDVLIPDRELKMWLPSNPKGYAAWFEGRSELYFLKLRERAVEALPDHGNANAKTTLQRTVQLLKRWRDVTYHKLPDAAPCSIVLTTLAGHAFTGTLSTAAAFGEIVREVATATARNGEPPRVENPAQPGEVLSEQWERDLQTYRLFRTQIGELHRQWVEIREAANTEAVANALGALFGEAVTKHAFKRLTTEHIEPARKTGALGVRRSSGALSIEPTSGIVGIRRNTFYGSD